MAVSLLHWSQYLQNHTPKFKAENHSKFFKNNSHGKQPYLMSAASDNRHLFTNSTGWMFQIQFMKHQLRWIYNQKKQLRQNGDLACLDFVVNRTAHSVISSFCWSLESSFGYNMWKLVEYCFEANWHIFFSSNRSICCVSSSFEGNKANRLIRIKQSSTLEKNLSMFNKHCLHSLL